MICLMLPILVLNKLGFVIEVSAFAICVSLNYPCDLVVVTVLYKNFGCGVCLIFHCANL